jgi:hypothetical protein
VMLDTGGPVSPVPAAMDILVYALPLLDFASISSESISR